MSSRGSDAARPVRVRQPDADPPRAAGDVAAAVARTRLLDVGLAASASTGSGGPCSDACPSPCRSITCSASTSRRSRPRGSRRSSSTRGCVGPEGDEIKGYPVYLDGVLSQQSWWYYYLFALAYKVPEGTWAAGRPVARGPRPSRRRRGPPGSTSSTLLAVPLVVLVVMSVFTNINLGLRYVLPIFPYLFIGAGKLVPWAAGMGSVLARRLGVGRRSASAWRPRLPRRWIHRRTTWPISIGVSGGPDARLGAPDRQQPRLGPGPRRPEAMARRPRARGAGRARLLRADQPVDLRGEGGAGDRMVPAAPLAGDDAAERPAPPAGPVRPSSREAAARALRGQRVAGAGPALAGLR